ncbi:MAG: Deoxyribose-phosphate aldolase [Phycisphaerae bacterium]|nr:Deoxyribose-phosphate aldolase [Phycisphaerae bacterium]
MTRGELARRMDHTVLKAETTPRDIERLCREAMEYEMFAVCVNPTYVSMAVRLLKGSRVRVATVAGFPLGSNITTIKVQEARAAVEEGADEVDMVLNLGRMLADETQEVADDISAVAQAVHQDHSGRLLKVILETSALSSSQIITACHLCRQAGADFVKTSTGFHSTGGASVEAVRLMKQHAAPLLVKASGGIRDLAAAEQMVAAGADRLGTSSSVAILEACRS